MVDADRIRAEMDGAPRYNDAGPDGPPPPGGPEDYGGGAANDTSTSGGPMWPSPLDLAALAEQEPPQPGFIIRDWLPAGYATLMAGHGGAGKSTIMLEALVCIAAGIPWCGLHAEQRRVLFLSCEDRSDVLHWRLSRTCQRLGINMADLAGRLEILDLVGSDTTLWDSQNEKNRPEYRELYQKIQTTCADILAVDGVSDVFGGDEINRNQVKAFINALLGLIDPHHGAVMLLGHVAKQPGGEGYSGSTQWHNAVRARWYLYPEQEKDEDIGRTHNTGEMILDLQKSNLGRADQELRFRWNDDAHTFVGWQPEGGGQDTVDRIQEANERQSILDAINASWANDVWVPAARQGRQNAHNTLSATGYLDKKLTNGTAGKRVFYRRIDELRQMGFVAEEEYRRSHRRTTQALIAKSPE